MAGIYGEVAPPGYSWPAGPYLGWSKTMWLVLDLLLVQVTYSAKPSWFDRPVLSIAEGLTTNGTQPFGLSLSKASGNRRPRRSPDYALGTKAPKNDDTCMSCQNVPV
jgi:hypothetical protein